MSKIEKLLDVITSERSVDHAEAKDLLRHYYYGMTQVLEEMEMKRDEAFELWAMKEGSE